MSTLNYVDHIVAAHNAKIDALLIPVDDCRIETVRADSRDPSSVSVVISTPVRDSKGKEVSRRNGQCRIVREPIVMPEFDKVLVVSKEDFKSAFELKQLVALELDLDAETLIGPLTLKQGVNTWTFEIGPTNLNYFGKFKVVAK